MIGKRWFLPAVLATAMTGGLFMVAGVPQSRAADKDDACRVRLEATRVRLDRDISHFGANSKQADRDRVRMAADRDWCRGHHMDWDHGTYDRDDYMRH
jgi:hypothetical protein